MNDDCPVTDEQRRLFHELVDRYCQSDLMTRNEMEALIGVANRFSWLEDKLAASEAAVGRATDVLQRAYSFFFQGGEDSYEAVRKEFFDALTPDVIRKEAS